MKKLLAITAVLLTTGAAFAQSKQVFMEAGFSACELQHNGSKVATVGRESICTIGPHGSFCITNVQNTVNRTFLPGKVSAQKIGGVKYILLTDNLSSFFFARPDKKKLLGDVYLLAEFTYKGTKGQLSCAGSWNFISGKRFGERGKNWNEKKTNKKSVNRFKSSLDETLSVLGLKPVMKSAFCRGFEQGYLLYCKGFVPFCPFPPFTPFGSTPYKEGIKAGIARCIN